MNKRYSTDRICGVLGWSRQGYYKHQRLWFRRSLQEQEVLALVLAIRRQHPRMGVRKLFHKIRPGVGRDRLFSILRKNQLLVAPLRRRVCTTYSRHRFRTYRNLIAAITPIQPDQIYVADITYIRTLQGFCYLSLLTDKYSRRIVGYHLSRSLAIEGSLKALRMALNHKRRGTVIHHSDRGLQYCSHAYTGMLHKHGAQISMTEKDHVYENALAERVNGILKIEYALGETLPSYEIAAKMTSEAVNKYNNERPHMALNYQTPNEVHYQTKAA